MAVTINDPRGSGPFDLSATGVRGDNATEALADLLMGPGSFIVFPTLVGVVIRAGIDVRWMAQPPIAVDRKESPGHWGVRVSQEEGVEVRLFSADDVSELLTRLRAEYPT